jgi:signal transduction histidine kinase/CheY-like chemotaxis protein/HAMP domain-containing protein
LGEEESVDCMKTHTSIRRLLIISLIILAIAPLILLSGVLLWQGFTVQQMQAKDLQKKMSMLASVQISSYIREQETALKSVVINVDLINMDRTQRYSILSKLLSSSSDKYHGDIFADITLLDATGKELAGASRSLFLKEADLGERTQAEEFAVPAKSGKVYYSPVYYNEQTGEPFLKISIPITDLRTMNVRGMLIAEIRMKYIWDVLAQVHVGESGSAYMVDKDGRVIAHPNPSIVLRGTYLKVPGQPGITNGLNGTRVVLDAEKIRLGDQLFFIITELPVAEGLRYTYRSILSAGIFFALTLSCAIALGFVLIRKIVQPLEALAGTAQSISKGDFSQRVHISRSDEIGALANVFNGMTSRLIETIHYLKKEIDERKQAEDKIARQNELLNNIMNSLTNPFYVIDAKSYTITMANSAAHFGDLTENTKCYSMTHKHDKPCEGEEHPCTIKEIMKTRKPVVLEHSHFNSVANPGYFSVYGYPIFDDDGNISQIIEYTIDITEKKKLEKQFLQAQKMEAVGNLAGGIAHDFNNLLSAIIGYSEIILTDLPESYPSREQIKIIKDAGEKAATLTSQLLAFSRKQILEIKVTNLCTIVENVTKILHRVIGEDIKLEINARPVRSVKADAGQIEQVVMNLAVNARDAMPNGGRLTIETEDVELDEGYAKSHAGVTPGAYVMLAVTDTGIGMSCELQEKIFEPFFTTKGEKGTGLGLSTVYGIIKQHGGNISAYSEPGMGSTFKIYLPSTGEAKEESASGEREPVLRGTETILVVDDEPFIRRLILDTLQPLGYRLLEASSGKEALRISSETGEKIDLLLTDVVMPEMNGIELARTIRKSKPSIKVIFTSGYTDNTIFNDGMRDEGMTFLQKPVTMKKLVSKLSSVLRETDMSSD